MRLVQQRAGARRGRMRRATAAIGVVLAGFAVLVAVKLAGGDTQQAAAPVPTGAAAATVIASLTSVPASVLDKIGAGDGTPPKAITGQAVRTDGGKPLVLYVGAEYCPFCAAQRWPVVVALSRFGTFTGLRLTASAKDDTFPGTPTVSFHGSAYTSQFLTFQGVETSTDVRQGNGYAPLDTLTEQQSRLVRTFNAPPYVPADSAGTIPFVDYADQAVSAGASFSPELLAGRTPAQVAAALGDPGSDIGKAVDGNANAITALLCKLTGDKPGDVCTGAAVAAYKGRI